MEKILLTELRKFEGQWLTKGSLFSLAYEHGYSPETLGRTLRHLEEEGQIEKSYYDGKHAKGLVQYSYKPRPKVQPTFMEINGVMTAIF